VSATEKLDVSIGLCSMPARLESFSFSFLPTFKESFLFSDSLSGPSQFSVSLLGTRFHGSFCTLFVFPASVQQRQSSISILEPFLLLLHTHRLRSLVEGVLIEGFEELEQSSEGMVKA
jgi:hypothetical protein